MSDETELGCFPTLWFQAPSWALPFLSHCCPGRTLPGPWGLEEGPDSLLPPPRCRSSSFPVNHSLRQVSVFPEVAPLSCVLMVPHSLTSPKPPYGHSSFPCSPLGSPACTSSLTGASWALEDEGCMASPGDTARGWWPRTLGATASAQPLPTWRPCRGPCSPHTLRFSGKHADFSARLSPLTPPPPWSPLFIENTPPTPPWKGEVPKVPPAPLASSLPASVQCRAEEAPSLHLPKVCFLWESPFPSGLWLLFFSLQLAQIPKDFSIKTHHPRNPEGYVLLTRFTQEDTDA